jgi:eukaryotic-like serine/threonine-protein kinase
MDLWQQVQQLFDSALQHSPEKRQEFLEQECGSNQELRREVESLLAARDESGSLMAEPAVAGRAEVLLPATSRFQLGDTLGAYKVLELVGRGGMGEVYRARDTRLKRDVAIKVLPRAFTADRERLRRFEQEARSAAALNHPNIISVHDMGTADGSPYIVSELLEGQNLREILRQGPVPARKVLDYALQVACGLAAAHDAGIVHRDLKPENLFITKDGQLKILDFGLAKLTRSQGGGADCSTTEAVPGTEAGTVFGTVGYMSPEQVRGQSADHRSDIFSFGAILYELFSGKRAFSGDSPADTLSAILHQDPPELTSAIPPVHPAVDRTIRHCLEKNPLERFQSAHDLAFQMELAAEGLFPKPEPAALQRSEVVSAQPLVTMPHATPVQHHRVVRWKLIVPVAVVVAAAVAIGVLFYTRPATALTEKDTVVLADLANKTGDPIFEDTLKQALAVDLEQSPFLNVLSDKKVNETLGLMGRSPGERVTADVAREICLRTASKAVLAGSIAALGGHYVIGLRGVNCQTGDSLASAESEADGQAKVLQALGQAVTTIRSKLGESLASIEKFDKPLEDATTSSLEALKAYSQARRIQAQKGDTEAIPFLKRAVELDPNFAVAYSLLGMSYRNLGQTSLAIGNLKKAYELRERVSEREQFHIATWYYERATGELEKAKQQSQLWIENYPRDVDAHLNLGWFSGALGQFEEAATSYREALRLDPYNAKGYANLADTYLRLNRLDEAKAAIDEALAHKLDYARMHDKMYALAFLRGDVAGMQQQVAWAMGKPGMEDDFLSLQFHTEVYYGRLQKGRELTRRAVDSAKRNNNKELAALAELDLAIEEALSGNAPQARQAVTVALASASGRDVQMIAALTLAMAGDAASAQKLGDKLNKDFPLDTMIQGCWLPAIQAEIELSRGNAVKAIELLQTTSPHELGMWLYPAYIRGLAYLRAAKADAAATEFQKILDHRGLLGNSQRISLAHLGLARAHVLSQDTAKARSAYQDFLELWQDADPDIPILKEAKAEYAKLQ